MTRPATGVPRAERRPKIRGNNPSCATAIGNCPTIRIQPFSAPKHEMAAPSAMTAAARSPASARAASAYGAVVWPSVAGESTPMTPTVLTM